MAGTSPAARVAQSWCPACWHLLAGTQQAAHRPHSLEHAHRPIRPSAHLTQLGHPPAGGASRQWAPPPRPPAARAPAGRSQPARSRCSPAWQQAGGTHRPWLSLAPSAATGAAAMLPLQSVRTATPPSPPRPCLHQGGIGICVGLRSHCSKGVKRLKGAPAGWLAVGQEVAAGQAAHVWSRGRRGTHQRQARQASSRAGHLEHGQRWPTAGRRSGSRRRRGHSAAPPAPAGPAGQAGRGRGVRWMGNAPHETAQDTASGQQAAQQAAIAPPPPLPAGPSPSACARRRRSPLLPRPPAHPHTWAGPSGRQLRWLAPLGAPAQGRAVWVRRRVHSNREEQEAGMVTPACSDPPAAQRARGGRTSTRRPTARSMGSARPAAAYACISAR